MEENNFSKSIFIKSIVLTVLVTALVTSMVTMIVMNNNESSSLLDKISTKLASIEQIVDKDYLGEIDENKIFDETMKGYVDGLDDEYSQYFTKEELEEYRRTICRNWCIYSSRYREECNKSISSN